jgi:23S rRNA U2552 (ribose-2'-O)-methylase RlmE/FtsJ
LSDKWEHYLPIYESYLAPRVADGAPLRLLEIGVQNGGSLEIWADFLPSGSKVTGIDIDPNCASLSISRDIRILTADATNFSSIDELLGDETFDVIVDDGSHRQRMSSLPSGHA